MLLTLLSSTRIHWIGADVRSARRFVKKGYLEICCKYLGKDDIIIQITQPIFKIQELFASSENYADPPAMLAFYVYSEEAVIYTISRCGSGRLLSEKYKSSNERK